MIQFIIALSFLNFVSVVGLSVKRRCLRFMVVVRDENMKLMADIKK